MASGSVNLPSNGTTLSGDVSGTSSATVVDTVGTSTAANIHAAELLANAAASANTASTIVKRDSSGNFSAGTVTASLTGLASLNVAKATLSANGDLLTRTAGVPAALAVSTPGYVVKTDNTSLAAYEPGVDPIREYNLKDDFVNSNSTSPYGELGWTDVGAGGTGSGISLNSTNIDGNHLGILRLSTGTTTGGGAGLALSSASSTTASGIILDANNHLEEFLIKLANLSDVTDEYTFMVGLGRHTTNTAQINGIYFLYDRTSSVNWQLVSAKASTLTTRDTGFAVGTGWTRLRFDATTALITGYVNDVVCPQTITTNIPILNIAAMQKINKTAGTTARVYDVDYYRAFRRLATAR